MREEQNKPNREHRAAQTSRVVRTAPRTEPSKWKGPKSKKKRVTHTVLAAIGRFLLAGVLILTITACIVGTALTIYIMRFVDSGSKINLTDLRMNYTTVIYGVDGNGNNAEVQRLHRAENRVWVDMSRIPQCMRDAVVYTEDERFYQHDGVDFKRTFAALLNEAANVFRPGDDRSRFGGSTITQQLVKIINGDIFDRTFNNKIKEVMQAMNLERNYSKDQILEAYLNSISLGYNTNGVQAGAKLYFNKDVSQLTINEAACLAVISKSPESYNPIANPKNNNRRRKYCLDKMLEYKAITKAEHDKYYNQDIVVTKKGSVGTSKKQGNIYGYFTDAVIEDVIKALRKEYNYSYAYAEQKVLTGGWKIYSTMDINAQNSLEKMFENNYTFAHGGTRQSRIPQASMVVCDYNGNVRALVGGRGEKTASRCFNRATQAVRSFGSTIKPLTIFAPSFEKNLVNWSTIVNDAPKMKKSSNGLVTLTDNVSERNWPQNYNKSYQGRMTMISAIQVSKNTIPVELCNKLTPQYCYNFLTNNFEFPSLVSKKSQIGQDTMALGSAGTSLVDVTAAYQIFGDGGFYTTPTLYSKVVDASGKTILDAAKTHTKKQVLSPQTAYIMNRALWCVVNQSPGSGVAARLSNWETVGKTGTSMDRKDLLFVGCTPYYVAGIRYGFDNNDSIPDSISNSQVGVWRKVMQQVLKNKNPAKFELDSSGVVKANYDRYSGKIVDYSGSGTGVGYYKSNNIASKSTLESAPGTSSQNNSSFSPSSAVQTYKRKKVAQSSAPTAEVEPGRNIGVPSTGNRTGRVQNGYSEGVPVEE